MSVQIDSPIHDLVLVLGSDGATKVPACSQVMSSASRVFAAMLSGRFVEGRNLSVIEPEDLELPDDDAMTLQVVVRILHHRNEDVPTEMTRDEILGIARVVDKYDLCAALKWTARCWFMSCKCDCLETCAALAVAAYLMGEEAAFQRYTKCLVMDYAWTVGSLLKTMEHEAIPPQTLLRVVVEMESQRAEVYERLADFLHRLSGRFCELNCAVVQQIVKSIQSSIGSEREREPYAGLQVVSIREALQGIQNANIPDTRFQHQHNHLEKSDIISRMQAASKAADNKCRGVCLRCVHDDNDLSVACTEHENPEFYHEPASMVLQS